MDSKIIENAFITKNSHANEDQIKQLIQINSKAREAYKKIENSKPSYLHVLTGRERVCKENHENEIHLETSLYFVADENKIKIEKNTSPNGKQTDVIEMHIEKTNNDLFEPQCNCIIEEKKAHFIQTHTDLLKSQIEKQNTYVIESQGNIEEQNTHNKVDLLETNNKQIETLKEEQNTHMETQKNTFQIFSILGSSITGVLINDLVITSQIEEQNMEAHTEEQNLNLIETQTHNEEPCVIKTHNEEPHVIETHNEEPHTEEQNTQEVHNEEQNTHFLEVHTEEQNTHFLEEQNTHFLEVHTEEQNTHTIETHTEEQDIYVSETHNKEQDTHLFKVDNKEQNTNFIETQCDIEEEQNKYLLETQGTCDSSNVSSIRTQICTENLEESMYLQDSTQKIDFEHFENMETEVDCDATIPKPNSWWIFNIIGL